MNVSIIKGMLKISFHLNQRSTGLISSERWVRGYLVSTVLRDLISDAKKLDQIVVLSMRIWKLWLWNVTLVHCQQLRGYVKSIFSGMGKQLSDAKRCDLARPLKFFIIGVSVIMSSYKCGLLTSSILLIIFFLGKKRKTIFMEIIERRR